jgi:cytochrome P450
MFDSSVFEDANRFRTDRPLSAYLHFGQGMHECFAERINLVFIPEVVAALLRSNRLRRAPGRAGKLVYDGPLPRRLVVEFEPQPARTMASTAR